MTNYEKKSDEFENAVKIAFEHVTAYRKWQLVCSESSISKLKDKGMFISDLARTVESSGWKFHEVLGSFIWDYEIEEYDSSIQEILDDLKKALIDCRSSGLKLMAYVNKEGKISHQ